MNKGNKGRLFISLIGLGGLAACSGGEPAIDGRYENRDDLPSVLVRDLDV